MGDLKEKNNKKMSKRKRGQNFSSNEKDRLLKLLLDHKDTLLNKKTDGETNESKCLAWTEITNTFNASGSTFRTKECLMKVWEKLKTESKLYYKTCKRAVTQTGGGKFVTKPDPIIEQVCIILGQGTGNERESLVDSDNLDNTEEDEIYVIKYEDARSKIICLNDKTLLNTETTTTLNATHPEVIEDQQNIKKSLPWFKRRPKLSHPNESNEAVSSPCDSFQDLYKMKETLEDLKCQIQREELEYKRELYKLNLQAAAKEIEIKNKTLQAAAKDVEIKNEILAQIKGGALGLQIQELIRKK